MHQMNIKWIYKNRIAEVVADKKIIEDQQIVRVLKDKGFDVLVTFDSYDYRILWRYGNDKSIRRYYNSLSNYPNPNRWETFDFINFLIYELGYGRRIAIWFQDEKTLKTISTAIDDYFIKGKKNIVALPKKLTHCRSCIEKGCMTNFLKHTASVQNSLSIFKEGKILSACKARKTDGKTLMKEKRNAAGDPADYFEYIQFSFGNCITGDRLVMERMLGKNPSEEHLKDSFYPGISYYFDYQKLLSHPDYCNDGYHPCKIKDSLSLNDYLHAIIIPKKEEKSLRPIISTDLINRTIFMDNTGHDLWSWTSKCYKKIKKLNSLRY